MTHPANKSISFNLTTKLNNGQTVLAKMYKGEPSAMTFTNRTQAEAAAERTGGEVCQFDRRGLEALLLKQNRRVADLESALTAIADSSVALGEKNGAQRAWIECAHRAWAALDGKVYVHR